MKIFLLFVVLLFTVAFAHPSSWEQCVADSLICVEECQTFDQTCLTCIINDLPECCEALFPNSTICNSTMSTHYLYIKNNDCQGAYAEIYCERCANGPCVDPISIRCGTGIDIVGCGKSAICCPAGKQATCNCNNGANCQCV